MVKIIKGTSNKILEIDLTDSTFSVSTISKKDRKLYLGGKGLVLKLLFDRQKPKTDPFSANNYLAFDTGVIMGTNAPCSARFSAVTKSPLTNTFFHSSCGGPFGMTLKTSGWDSLLIKGKASKPVYLVIDKNGVEFKDAKHLWGKTTTETEKLIANEGTGSLIIGPAGENLVRFANMKSGHRFLGRGGLGAVAGSKNLKAIVAKGKEFKIEPVNKSKFQKVRKKLNKYLWQNPVTSKNYRNLGTSSHVLMSNKENILPVLNFKDGSHKNAELIAGETYLNKYKFKHHTCKPCSILCGHKATINNSEVAIPEYETIGLLGSNLGIFNPEKIAQFNEMCGNLGLDTISTGGTLAYAMELKEKGIFDFRIDFGEEEKIADYLQQIAYTKGAGKELSQGTKILSEKYGGKEFAINVKGLEVAAYDPRGSYGHGLSLSVANRGGCHLSASMFVPEVYFNLASRYKTKGKEKAVKFFENIYTALNSLHVCQFTAYGTFFEPPLVKYTPFPLLKFFTDTFPTVALNLMDISVYPKLWSSITGIPLSSSKFKKTGERIHVLERYMNTKEGIDRKDDTLPMRFLNESRISDNENRMVPLKNMLDNYYKARGYDKNGIPTEKLLKKLKILKKEKNNDS
jgi:aldehyde:ferredoxin oxidoreductase